MPDPIKLSFAVFLSLWAADLLHIALWVNISKLGKVRPFVEFELRILFPHSVIKVQRGIMKEIGNVGFEIIMLHFPVRAPLCFKNRGLRSKISAGYDKPTRIIYHIGALTYSQTPVIMSSAPFRSITLLHLCTQYPDTRVIYPLTQICN